MERCCQQKKTKTKVKRVLSFSSRVCSAFFLLFCFWKKKAVVLVSFNLWEIKKLRAFVLFFSLSTKDNNACEQKQKQIATKLFCFNKKQSLLNFDLFCFFRFVFHWADLILVPPERKQSCFFCLPLFKSPLKKLHHAWLPTLWKQNRHIANKSLFNHRLRVEACEVVFSHGEKNGLSTW